MKNHSNEDFIQNLQIFGLSAEEVEVYLALLEKGKIGDVVGNLKENLEISRTTIYGILNRLKEKQWVEEITIRTNPKRTKFQARSPFKILNQIINLKEKELELLKRNLLFMGDNLEKIYLNNKDITIEKIHPDTRKFLKPLFDNNWKVISEVSEHSETYNRRVFDYELLGPHGIQKNCGLIIFEYSRFIEKDINLIQSTLKFLLSKSEYEIRTHNIPGFEDLKFEGIQINSYDGVNVYIKFKTKKTETKPSNAPWILIGKQVAIPIQNKIFLIWGEETNFQFLMEVILKTRPLLGIK